MKNIHLTDYFFELGMLKKIYHNGPQAAGVKTPDTVAEHVYRASVIGFVLGEMEGVSGEKVATTVLFHDNPESRIGDHNKIAQRYINREESEKKVLHEQMNFLPDAIAQKITAYWNAQQEKTTTVGKLAYEADLIETALQAKEYLDLGYPTEGWIRNVKEKVRSKSGKQLLEAMDKKHFTDWWQGLKMV
ncbi:HD domain-containing protein [Candidatus Peregrinibacteria bacterium]|nr:HD domain-containing protein [Candidatus Peregrinibacteria bacterium]